MHRSLLALGLLAALAVPAAAQSDNLSRQNDVQTQQGFDNSASVDTTTTGSITPDYAAPRNDVPDANQHGSLQRGDQSTLFGANR